MALACATAMAVSGLTPGPGLTLCLGFDGHMDLAATCGDCGEAESPIDGDSNEPCAEGPADCCPCIDLSLAAAGDTMKGRTGAAADGPACVPVGPMDRVLDLRAGITSAREPGPPPGQRPSARIRSVILRI